MYMELDGQRYACTGMPTLEGDTLRFCLPEGGPELGGEPAGTAVLCRDDGFELWRGSFAGRLRWCYEGDVLTVTDLPEPEPAPAPEPGPPGTEVTNDQLVQAVVDLQYEMDRMKLYGGMST